MAHLTTKETRKKIPSEDDYFPSFLLVLDWPMDIMDKECACEAEAL